MKLYTLPSLYLSLFFVTRYLPSTAAFTCTGFDPVYANQAKKDKFPFYSSSSNNNNLNHSFFVPSSSSSSPDTIYNDQDRLRILNEGAQRYLAAIETLQHETYENKLTRRILTSSTSTSSSTTTTTTTTPSSSSSLFNVLPFRLDKVTLANTTILYQKQQVDLDYLVWLDPDSILYNFRNTSNLPLQGASPFGGWEDPDCLLRGHFSGHWLSATALMYNATGNTTVLQHAQYVVNELAKCQKANVNVAPVPGYLSGFPASQFDDLENLVPYPKQWSPYYTIHKIAAGLRDQYIYTGNTLALQLLENMAGYFLVRIRNVINADTIAKWYAILNQEFGGFNEVLIDLYTLTGNSTYLDMALLFSKPCFSGPLALDADQLDAMHANAHIPIIVGHAKYYETVGGSGGSTASLYSDIAMNFHDIVTHNHAYATGNGNHGEYYQVPGRLGDTLDGDTEESCTSYNMLKLGRHIFTWTGDVYYADWYERLFTNGMLSTLNPNGIGQVIYMLPLATVNGSSKGWSDPLYSMTCCVGTSTESFAKLGDSLYFHQDTKDNYGVPSIYVLQYHSSSVVWDTVGAWQSTGTALQLTQSAVWNDQTMNGSSNGYPGQFIITLTTTVLNGGTTVDAAVVVRIPSWVDSTQVSITVNGVAQSGPFTPLSWYNLTRTWSSNDNVILSFPFAPVRLEYIVDDRVQYNTTAAVMTGPFMLASPSQIGSALYNDPTNVPGWILPLSLKDRNTTSLLAGGSGGGGNPMYFRHDTSSPSTNTFNAVVETINTLQGTDGPDSTWRFVTPGLTGITNTVSIESVNYPGFFVCALSSDAKAVVTVTNYDATSSTYNSSCTYKLHTPGLTGLPNTVSFELSILANSYLSWYGGGNSVTVQPYQNGNSNYLNMTTWTLSTSNWNLPMFSYRAYASSTSRQTGLLVGRDYLLYPLHEILTETYVAYYQVTDYTGSKEKEM